MLDEGGLNNGEAQREATRDGVHADRLDEMDARENMLVKGKSKKKGLS